MQLMVTSRVVAMAVKITVLRKALPMGSTVYWLSWMG